MVALAMAVSATLGCDGDDVSSDEGTGGAAGVYGVTVAVTSDSGTLSTIAIDLAPATVAGDFVTDAGRPDCQILAPGAFGVISVLEDDRLRIGVASFIGFDTPVELARCKFDALEPVAPTDFSAELVDAVAPSGTPPNPPPVVEPTSVAAEERSTTTTSVGEASTTTIHASD